MAKMNKGDWTTVALNKKQICFLDGISKRSKFSGGRKLSRTAILRAILKMGRNLKVDVSGVKSERKLEERVFSKLPV